MSKNLVLDFQRFIIKFLNDQHLETQIQIILVLQLSKAEEECTLIATKFDDCLRAEKLRGEKKKRYFSLPEKKLKKKLLTKT